MDAKEYIIQSVRCGYAKGWSFTPLAMTPPAAGKRPMLRDWQHAARETLEQALEWAAAGNVGLRTGANSGGLLVVDLDTAKPEYDAEKVKALSLPRQTVTARTGSGGWHLYFRLPDGVSLGNSSGKLAPAVDTRGDGGQVVFPGSLHIDSGNRYAWQSGLEPWSIDVAMLPDNVVAALRGQSRQSPPPVSPAHGARSPIPGQSPYIAAAIGAEVARVSSAQPGTRNATLNEAAFALGQFVGGGVLAESDVIAALTPPAEAIGLTSSEIAATIRSGIAAGRAEPRGVPEPAPRHHGRKGGGQEPAAPAGGFAGLGQREPASGKLILSTRRTLPTAKAYIDEFATHDGVRTLHSHAGRLLQWQDNRYVEVEDGLLKMRLQPWLHDALDGSLEPFPANPATVQAALETIRAACHLPAATESPSWLIQHDDDPRDILPCRTVNLHIPSGRVSPATPHLFTLNSLNFDYDDNAPEPANWLEFLNQLWGDDKQAIDLLQEWFGYCLTTDTRQQKMLLLVGPRRSGKGTIGRILGELIGNENKAGPTTASLAGQFGLQPLLGKSLAIVSDARFSGSDMQAVVERLLCITGEDSITVERKHLSAVTVKLPTRFVFLTNELPRLQDAAGALAGRFLILTLQRSFYGSEDPGLTKRLLDELPGILKWAIEGWIRLDDRGRFVVPESSQETEQLLGDLTSPVAAFLRQCCELGPGRRATLDELYRVWVNWCEAEGRRPTNRQGFGRDLATVMPGLRSRRNHETGRFYDGLGLRYRLPEAGSPSTGTQDGEYHNE